MSNEVHFCLVSLWQLQFQFLFLYCPFVCNTIGCCIHSHVKKQACIQRKLLTFSLIRGWRWTGGEVDLILQPVHARNPLNISQRNEWAKIKVCSVVQVYQLHQSALSKVWKQVMTGQSIQEMNMCHQLISFDFSMQSISLFLHELNRTLHRLCTVELKGKAKSFNVRSERFWSSHA